MKKILFLFWICVTCYTESFSQISSLGRVFPVDTTGTNNGKIVVANGPINYRITPDTLYYNAELDYLSWNYNTDNLDSLYAMADTILYRSNLLFIYDSTISAYSDTLIQQIGFYWKKGVTFNNSMIASYNTAYKTTSGCTLYRFQKHSGYLCYELVTCPNQTNQYWCSDYSYTKIFEDNFEGNTLNTTMWRYTCQGAGDCLIRNAQVGYNSSVGSGTLKLYAKRETTIPYTDYDFSTHTNIYSECTIAAFPHFGFGKFEIRAKIPDPYGVNPSYWLYAGGTNHYELDGFEFFTTNRGDLPTMTMYTDANYVDFHTNCIKSGSNQIRAAQFRADALPWPALPDLSLDFHIYTLIWDPHYVTWSIDNTWFVTIFNKQDNSSSVADPAYECGCTSCTTKGFPQFPYINGDMIFVLQNAVSSTTSGTGAPSTPGPTAGSPAVFEIDWVKIYGKDNCATNTTYSSGTFNQAANGYRNEYTAQNLTLGGAGAGTPFRVQWYYWQAPSPIDNTLFTKADEEIALLDGFEVWQGASFEASIAYDGRVMPGYTPSSGPSDCANINNFYTQWIRSSGNPSSFGTLSSSQSNNITPSKIVTSEDDLKNFRVYPNPANSEVIIEGLNNYQYVEIINSTLQTIKVLHGKSKKIDVTELQSGLYFLRIYCDNKVIIHKFIKE